MKKGAIFLEVILAIAVLAFIVISTFPLLNFLLKRTQKSKYEAQATLILQEGIEISYNIFQKDFTYTSGIYHPEVFNSRWVLRNGAESNIQSRFDRLIRIEKVCRNSTGDMEPAGTCTGMEDRNAKYVTSEVKWSEDTGEKTIKAQLVVINK